METFLRYGINWLNN